MSFSAILLSGVMMQGGIVTGGDLACPGKIPVDYVRDKAFVSYIRDTKAQGTPQEFMEAWLKGAEKARKAHAENPLTCDQYVENMQQLKDALNG